MTTWIHWLVIALGGALGAMGRFGVVQLFNRLPGSQFPWGTLSVNALGSFVIGLAFVYFGLRDTDPAGLGRSLVMVGLLGAFTTFSSFALEGLVLIQQQHYASALAYLIGSVLICLAAVVLGFSAGKLVF